ncbi:energy-coupling factor transporter transmembrane protein EcfT [Desulfofundulus thermobenzoicus]|uniref:Energy-coupling factor transporter transmembrane protein EcfT n=1 Tax=Desulfofundulus thermobenzoicus TaxID=29376 RepID=A0A6N7IPJ6_9FIRM|nr:energy-coupling factor transporter transmembrane component T [Desulfofundulus thermobenzoicus]MQL51497.1 energy-coupling factor transporter transmembrane protein EcfT [Desulfofundulus thermobenzoicus]
MPGLVDYVPGASLLHRLHPLTKMFWALTVFALAMLFSQVPYLLALLGLVLVFAAAGGVLGVLRPACRGLFIFALVLLLIQALAVGEGRVLFYFLPWIPAWPVTDGGLLLGVAMGLRMVVIVLSFLVFLATTETREIILVLVEKLRVPYDYAFMLMTAIRFVPTFFAEAHQVREAQQARGYRVEGSNPLQKIKAYAPVAVPLVLLSLRRAEHLAMAMETRGYGCGPRTYLREPRVKGVDYAVWGLLLLLLAAAVLIRLLPT